MAFLAGIIIEMITTKADNQKRVLVPQAKPEEVYAIEENGDGSLTLSLVGASAPPSPTCIPAKEGGYTVAVPEQPIDELAINELLADFP